MAALRKGLATLTLQADLIKFGTLPTSAQDDPEVRARAEGGGCTAYFRKSDSGAEVIEAIRRLAASTAGNGNRPQKNHGDE
jgi:hypothetical protein